MLLRTKNIIIYIDISLCQSYIYLDAAVQQYGGSYGNRDKDRGFAGSFQ